MQGMRQLRHFSQINREYTEGIRHALTSLKDEKGESILDSKMIESFEASDAGEVKIKLQLSKNYRKAKSVVQTHLQQCLPWVTKINISMAAQQV